MLRTRNDDCFGEIVFSPATRTATERRQKVWLSVRGDKEKDQGVVRNRNFNDSNALPQCLVYAWSTKLRGSGARKKSFFLALKADRDRRGWPKKSPK